MVEKNFQFQYNLKCLPRSSSGLGRWVFIPEITGSTPVRGTGWRFDGIHEDLGPVNGPLPLQELIRANYIYTASMIRNFIEAKQTITTNNTTSK